MNREMKGGYNIIFIIACYFIANGIYVPAMPNVAEYFGAAGESVRATMTFFQFGALISCVIAGFFADNFGKKNFLILGLLISLTGSLICLFAPHVNMLVLGRFLQGMGAATGFMMGFALAVDLYKPDITLKIIALNGIIVSLLSAFIPYIGGTLTNLLNWRVTFVFMAIMFGIALINSIRAFPNKANAYEGKVNLIQGLTEFKNLLCSRTYTCYAILNSIFIGGLTFSISFLPFYYKYSMHLQESTIGFLIGAAIWLPFGICSIYSLKLYKTFGIDKTIYLALFFGILGAILMIVAASGYQHFLFPILIASILYYICFGLLYSGSITQSMSVYKELTTKASSLRTMMISFFSFLGGFLAQHADDKNLLHFAIILLVSTVLSAIIFACRGKINNTMTSENNNVIDMPGKARVKNVDSHESRQAV